ncbi:hypothetical protein L596_006215 [Steinernema carpocapsae]|uniref:Uncharacterized protein n=1 Tax=Steinernema carpocapsae TaxID=34508 RepID=A0A4U8V2Y0_STECR|nr:hypothetical protein L596_006215 [Steinernema carpocapsae]
MNLRIRASVKNEKFPARTEVQGKLWRGHASNEGTACVQSLSCCHRPEKGRNQSSKSNRTGGSATANRYRHRMWIHLRHLHIQSFNVFHAENGDISRRNLTVALISSRLMHFEL